MRTWTGTALATAVLMGCGVAAADPGAITRLAFSGDAPTVTASSSAGLQDASPAPSPETEGSAEPPAAALPTAPARLTRGPRPEPAAPEPVKSSRPDAPAPDAVASPEPPPAPDAAQVDGDLAAFVERAERAAAEQRQPASAAGPLEFGLASFNVLGASHTEPGSDADHFAPWRVRGEWTAAYIEQRRFDIVGLQELSPKQFVALMRATGNEFDAWPGIQLPKRASHTSLIWRKDRFEAVQRRTLTIDFMYWQHPIPVVQLRDRATQRTFWVINTHNAPRAWESQRDAATAAQLSLIRELRATGEPVFFLGDMNEREETACRVFGTTDLVSPAGGSNDGRCILPANRRIDWIFGPPEARYSGYVLDRSGLVKQVTDHFVPQTRVSIG